MKRRRHWVGSVVLPVIVLLMGVGLAAWKYDAIQAGQAASASQPEPMETVTVDFGEEDKDFDAGFEAFEIEFLGHLVGLSIIQCEAQRLHIHRLDRRLDISALRPAIHGRKHACSGKQSSNQDTHGFRP